MKLILVLLICLGSGMGLADEQVSFEFREKGDRSLGLQIKGLKSVLHEAGHQDSPMVYYYIVDKDGRKHSPVVGFNLFPAQKNALSFDWVDHQKYLVSSYSGRADYGAQVFARDAKGNFKELKTALDPEQTVKKIALVTQLKGHPEWGQLQKTPSDWSETASRDITSTGVSTDDIFAGDTSVDLPVLVTMDDEWVTIRYRFDAKTRKFTRLDATLARPPNDHRVITLSNAELEKAIKEIVLKKG